VRGVIIEAERLGQAGDARKARESFKDGTFRLGGGAPRPIRELVAEPGELPFGVSPGIALGCVHGLKQRNVPIEGGDQARHAVGFHGRQQGVEAAPAERLHLRKRAIGHHGVEADVDARVESSALQAQDHFEGLLRVDERRHPRTVPGREGSAGRFDDLERAHDPHPVPGREPGRRHRITLRELGVQGAGALIGKPRPQGLPGRRWDRWDGGEPTRQGLQIEAGPANHDGQQTAARGLFEDGRDVPQPTADRISFRSVDMTKQSMRDQCLLGGAGPGCEDAQITIDLHGIRVDNDPAESLGNSNGEGRLAACRRPRDKHHPLDLAFLVMTRLMTHVATLICDPCGPALDEATIARARAALPDASEPRWLAPGIAADVFFTPDPGEGDRAAADALRLLLEKEAVDVVVQRTTYRRKKLLVADMDSTMIGQECIDELADSVGLKDRVAAITERAMRGEIAFEPALRERVALLAGLPAAVIGKVFAARIQATPGAATLVHTMRAHGAFTCLVSGGFTVFSHRVATMLGFDEYRANRLVIEDERLTREVESPILGPAAKRDALNDLRARFALAATETLALGDGANDLAMLDAAGLGVAYHAKPTVKAASRARIDHADLTALLYVQGYAGADLVMG
jgi:phosphoserine phosphatase